MYITKDTPIQALQNALWGQFKTQLPTRLLGPRNRNMGPLLDNAIQAALGRLARVRFEAAVAPKVVDAREALEEAAGGVIVCALFLLSFNQQQVREVPVGCLTANRLADVWDTKAPPMHRAEALCGVVQDLGLDPEKCLRKIAFKLLKDYKPDDSCGPVED